MNSQLGAALVVAILITAVATAALRPVWACPPRRRTRRRTPPRTAGPGRRLP